MLTFAVGAWCAGLLLWFTAQVRVVHLVAAVLLLCSVGATMLGTARLPGGPRRWPAAGRTAVDGLIVAGSLLLIAWVAGFDDVFGSARGPAAAALLVAWIAATATAGSAVVIFTRCHPASRPVLAASAAGLVLLAVGYTAFVPIALAGANPGDYVLLAAFAAGWAELWLAGRRTLQDAEAAPKVPGHLSVLIPSLPFAAAVIAFTATAAAGGLDSFMIWNCGAVVVLIIARQILALVENITFWRRLEAEAEARIFDAMHDPLTELPNRVLFDDRLNHAVRRRSEPSLAVLFVDIDDFKLINDCFGHDAGDAVLTAVGYRISGTLREGDTVARFGGDEFAVLLEDVGSEREAAGVAERILSALHTPVRVTGQDLRITASVGLATTFMTPRDAKQLLRGADQAMYAVKRRQATPYAICDSPTAPPAVDPSANILTA